MDAFWLPRPFPLTPSPTYTPIQPPFPHAHFFFSHLLCPSFPFACLKPPTSSYKRLHFLVRKGMLSAGLLGLCGNILAQCGFIEPFRDHLWEQVRRMGYTKQCYWDCCWVHEHLWEQVRRMGSTKQWYWDCCWVLKDYIGSIWKTMSWHVWKEMISKQLVEIPT